MAISSRGFERGRIEAVFISRYMEEFCGWHGKDKKMVGTKQELVGS